MNSWSGAMQVETRPAWHWPRRRDPLALGATPVRVGVVMLCHDHLHIAARLARCWVDGGAAVALHVDRATDHRRLNQMREQLSDLSAIIWTPQHRCEWGSFGLVRATQDAATMLLEQFPDVTHVLLVSGSCVPLRPISELAAYLARNPGRDHIESVTVADSDWVIGGLGDERFQFYFPFSWRRRRRLFDRMVDLQRKFRVRRAIPKGVNPHIGSQWWCLTRRTLSAILNDPRRKEYDRFFRQVWIPDESYFQTLTRLHSAQLESRSLTLAKFDSQGKPYIFYDDHIPMLEHSRSFVARKIWPRAHRLLRHFPRPADGPLQVDEPRPARIDRLINTAVARRALGRPGLYMQSRFPLKDKENGKTANPYAVFQGFDDAMPQFEEWLARLLPASQVHGHLFAPDHVEFSGRKPVGPGALSCRAALRDYDAQGFLTSLVRAATVPQVFQYGPRDNQTLNWFMTTDPNAYFAVITGCWALPLAHSDMPFDDIRRIAARLQAVEVKQLEILGSVWTKAKVKRWELADLLARPEAILREAVEPLIPAGSQVDPVPPLADTSRLAEFLQALRNTGLRPRLMGEIEFEEIDSREGKHG